jgi:hypothetical protein
VDLGLTRGEGAAYGATSGAAQGALQALDAFAGCEGSFCGIAILLVPVFALGGAVIGGISGAESGFSTDELERAEANARRALDSAYLQTSILDRTREYGHENSDLEFLRIPVTGSLVASDKSDYRRLESEAIDAVLKVDLVSLSLEEFLEMKARGRLVSVQTGAVLSDSEYLFLSERRRLNEWMANGAAPLTEAINRGLQTLAEDIVDENFLLFFPNEPEAITTADAERQRQQQPLLFGAVPHYVLRPDYPPLDTCFFCEGLFETRPHRAIGNLEFAEVDSVQPTLKWEQFPRDHDLTERDGKRHKIAEVSYDVRVFDTAIPSRSGFVLVPAQQIYSARSIPEPHHKIENGLTACSDYFWTVRARFKLDGRVRVTEWAGAFEVAGWNERPWNLRRGVHSYSEWVTAFRADGPEWFYYPFRTPCE